MIRAWCGCALWNRRPSAWALSTVWGRFGERLPLRLAVNVEAPAQLLLPTMGAGAAAFEAPEASRPSYRIGGPLWPGWGPCVDGEIGLHLVFGRNFFRALLPVSFL